MLELAKNHISADERLMINSYLEWLIEARPGDSIVYCTGFLGFKCRPGVRKVARHMLEAYGRGEVELTQRRLSAYQYEYIATKRKVKRAPQCFSLPPLENEPVAA